MTDRKKQIRRTIRKIRRAIRRPFEAMGYTLLKWTIPFLPRRAVASISRAAGNLAVRLPIREREVGLKNLDAVFGDTKTSAEKRQILATSIATFTQTMLDIFWFSRNPENRIKKYVTFKKSPTMDRLFDDRPLICITAHMGSWEILGQFAALHGADLASIAATVKNKAVDRILIEQREKTGQTIIPQKGALRTLISRLRNKEKVGFVLDQNTDPEDGGILVDFLGLPMSVSAAPASIAYRTGTPILLAFSIPQSDGKYVIEAPHIIPPPAFDKKADIDATVLSLTQEIEDRVSEQILKYPEYWLWSYKHWRKRPENNCPPNYPDY